MTTVLIADDDPDIRNLVGLKLEMSGYTVLAASDGPTALTAARDQWPDIALLDVMMPGMSGLELCRELRSDPATASMPVILITACSSTGEIETGYGAGADDYIVKPFSPRELVSRVALLLDRANTTGPASALPASAGAVPVPASPDVHQHRRKDLRG